ASGPGASELGTLAEAVESARTGREAAAPGLVRTADQLANRLARGEGTDKADGAASKEAPKAGETPSAARIHPPNAGEAAMTMPKFFDRLMMAESGGRLTARNARSTALGPFQFIES